MRSRNCQVTQTGGRVWACPRPSAMRALPSSRRSHISRPRDHRQDGGRSLLSPPRTCRHSNPKLKSPTSPKASHVAKSPQVCPHGDAKMGGRDVSQRPMTNVGADKDGYMTSHLFICRDHRRACRGRLEISKRQDRPERAYIAKLSFRAADPDLRRVR